jgi:hypothetical protein
VAITGGITRKFWQPSWKTVALLIAVSSQLSAISFFIFLTSSAVSQLLAVPHFAENCYKKEYLFTSTI